MNEKLEHIDSLRGIAILMVILVHTAQSVGGLPEWALMFTRYGQLGVQLFFVVSAVTLCLSAERRREEDKATVKYLLRRVFRIAPLYYFGILLYFGFLSLRASLEAGYVRVADFFTPLNMLTNFLFVHGFHPPANNEIVPGGWSIGTEMAFYLCFPVLFFFFRKANEKGAIWLALAAVLLVAGNFALTRWYLTWAGVEMLNNTFIYYNLLNQLPVFMLGILTYLLTRDHGFGKTPVLVDLALVIGFTWLTNFLWENDAPGRNHFMFVPFTAGLSFIFLHNLFSRVTLLNLSLLRRVGQVSFSMYIVHFIFARYGSQALNLWLADALPPLVLLGLYYGLTVSISFGLALLTERYIEKPGIEMGKQVVRAI